MAESVAVTVNQDSFVVNPGEAVEAVITVQNLGIAVGVFSIEVEGIDASWYTLSSNSVSLFPGDRASASLVISPPRASGALARTYQVAIRVVSQKDSTQQAEVGLSLDVLSFHAFTAELRPQRSRGPRGSHLLSITNTGNATLAFELRGQDPEGLCRFAFDPQVPQVPPGGTLEVHASVRGRRPLTGAPKTYRYMLTATPPAGTAPPVTVPGELEVPAWLPKWVLRAAAVVLVVVAVALVLWRIFFYKPPVAVAAFDVSPSRIALTEGETTELAVNARDKDGNPVSGHKIAWRVDSEGIVGIMSEAGGLATQVEGPEASVTLRGLSPGDAVVTAVLIDQDLEPKSATVTVLPVTVSTDCIRYDPGALRFGVENGKLALKSGQSVVLVLDEDADQSNALNLARQHTSRCFIGRQNGSVESPDSEIEFWTGNSGIAATVAPEYCEKFSPAGLQTRAQQGGTWLLTDGASLQLRLDNEADARSALILARRHSQRCFIGRQSGGGAPFVTQYWR